MSKTISLDLLERVRIASPCPARWEDMEGDERVRFCGRCSLNVYNLSAMSPAEAREVLDTDGRVCAGFWRRADGTILTRDCPVGVAAVRAKLVRAGARIAAAIGLLVTGRALAGTDAAGRLPLRSVEPFSAICKWLSPAPPPPPPGPPPPGPTWTGGIAVLAPPPHTPSARAPKPTPKHKPVRGRGRGL